MACKKRISLFVICTLLFSIFLLDSARGYSWGWISGSSSTDQSGDYGTINVASSNNVPGGHALGGKWVGKNGDFWLFGGYGNASGSSYGFLNDMWKWNGSIWTWTAGSDTSGATGTYGNKGEGSSTTVPGARRSFSSVTNSKGNFWLFGGWIEKDNGSRIFLLFDTNEWSLIDFFSFQRYRRIL